MHVKFILPSLTEARDKHWRSIKYSLFPPLGLATLAAYLGESDHADIVDEHVQELSFDDAPDLVAIETYVTSAYRAYRIADHYRSRGIPVVLGGLHASACPEEAAKHADTVVLGPAEEAWPRFLDDFRRGEAAAIYRSRQRDLASLPPTRRDLIQRRQYLVPNSIVVSRGCPHQCDFCYARSFFRNGKHFYTTPLRWALSEIDALPGRHLFFLDDNILGDGQFARALFDEMRPRNRIWQGAATVNAVLNRPLLDAAVESGLRSLFVGFESLNQDDICRHGKHHNRVAEYEEAIQLLHARGVMINASFVFGGDGDDASGFKRTAQWAVSQGIETATFHLLTPYPGTDLFRRYAEAGRIRHYNWDLYDTRHAVFDHPTLTAEALERGYWQAYRTFYSWPNILRSAGTKETRLEQLRHAIYVGAWRKMDPVWSGLIALRRLSLALPSLEKVLEGRSENAAVRSALDRPSPDRDRPRGHPDVTTAESR